MRDTGAFDIRWEKVHTEREWGKYPSEEVIKFVARNFYKLDRANIKILDMGCGTGANTWFMAREGFDTFGFDGSPTAVKKAIKRLEQEGCKANIKLCDAMDTGYDNEFFDAVVDCAMISSCKYNDILDILKETYRILKIGGRMISTGLFKVGMSGYGTGEKIETNTYSQIVEGPLANNVIVHFFDEKQIIELWQKSGFKNIVIDSITKTDFGGKTIIDYYIVQAEK